MKFCKKCKKETERYKMGQCAPCERAKSAAWHKDNSEKSKANSAAWRVANLEKHKANNAAYRAANPEKHKAKCAAWYKANQEKAKATSAAWRAANSKRVNASTAAWTKANPEKRRIFDHNRRAKQRANGGKLSPDLSAKLFKLQRGKCPCCKQPLGNDYHLDHIMPIDLGGANEDWNIQLLTQRCNNQKHAKDPIEFMQSRGFLI